jgi:hypothetical protein
MLNAVPKNSASPATMLGATASANSERCTVSRRHIRPGPASSQASAGVSTRSPPTRPSPGCATLGQADRTSTPESRNDKDVRVSLAAVAEHGHRAVLDQGQVGVVV